MLCYFITVMLAGAPGFEPGDGGTKNRCLTTWLRPNECKPGPYISVFEKHNRAEPTQPGFEQPVSPKEIAA